ncbi:hypothetical protein VRHSUH09_04050 [Veillonella rogosae JCM 15642]|uniref:Uncharacterized protein n=1 Tax=Veillonella rogosae JCM 15642 TaxID=1298595 RepID=A0ABX5BY82_9FIRM|nr:hypothetical protein [Veillonella rogosae]PQL12797.1 hypothetical protein VRHSUH09_04050 [Veillonella rogosae JCM 15642]
MGNNLKEEFIDVIKLVTKDVTNEVVTNTTLKSLEEHIKKLQKANEIIKNIEVNLSDGQELYRNIKTETNKTTVEFYKNLHNWKSAIEQENALISQLIAESKNFNEISNVQLSKYLAYIENLDKEYKTTQTIIRGIEDSYNNFINKQETSFEKFVSEMNVLIGKIQEQSEEDRSDYQKMFNNLSMRINIAIALLMLLNTLFVLFFFMN